jgi:arylsulfatase
LFSTKRSETGGHHPLSLGQPKAFNLITDPKEGIPTDWTLSTWVAGPALKVMVDFEASLKKYPPIAPGTPDPYKPPSR